MLKLLAIIAVVSSFANANTINEKIETFIEGSFENNPNIKSINAKVLSKNEILEYKNWNAYMVELDAILKKDGRQIVQKMMWFSDGEVVTKELFALKEGKEMNEFVSIPFKDKYYNKANLIYGNENAKHKVVIFSDPLCPFCKTFVPEAIDYMKKEPNKYALYYYHFPLESIHPASVELAKAAITLELQGRKNVVLDLYKVKVDPNEKSNEKILLEFNKVMNSNIKPFELFSKEVIAHFKNDLEVASMLMVNGTPTIFFDGKLDKTKMKYKEAK
ncbi:thioredoxin domain-containing protein [Sulfurimonas sp.]|jgi:thiol-disulfide isomerase/thioredoxin|uniref:DsbA family protein n=1 Tax=Sulfurimonas sp. TaxID=2022749 RepID=UPI0025EF1963|nr:thioredoxin domain-containing protein [Sulfurimonas sp.]MCK9473411.1 thioredoxin domain-containing protein [Sulfurimonas sp.]